LSDMVVDGEQVYGKWFLFVRGVVRRRVDEWKVNGI